MLELKREQHHFPDIPCEVQWSVWDPFWVVSFLSSSTEDLPFPLFFLHLVRIFHILFSIFIKWGSSKVISYPSFLFLSSEDQVVCTTRQEVDERRPSKSFVHILLLVFCLFELLNSNKCDNVLMCFWHLPLVLWHYNRNYLGKFCWHKQSETLFFLGFLKVFLVFDVVFLRLMVFFVEVCFF